MSRKLAIATDSARHCGPAAAADRLQLEQAGVHRDGLPRHGHAAHRPAGRRRPGRPRNGPGARRVLEPSRRHQGSQTRRRRARQRVQSLAGRPERPAVRRRLEVRRHPRLRERRSGCRHRVVRNAGSDPVHRALAADDARVSAAAVRLSRAADVEAVRVQHGAVPSRAGNQADRADGRQRRLRPGRRRTGSGTRGEVRLRDHGIRDLRADHDELHRRAHEDQELERAGCCGCGP